MTEQMDGARFRATAKAIIATVEQVIDGKQDQVELAVTALLAEGHLLIEDVPGVGKTQLARALAASIDTTSSRIQFTPDLLPGDVTGVSIFRPDSGEFEFKPGPVFHSVVIADEINRASPKTQSALLEAMAERQVTTDGATRRLPHPFLVVATQNPLEMEGTYALPEAQRDRFMVRLSMGYPDPQAEALMLRQRNTGDPLAELRPAANAAEVRALIAWARGVHLSPAAEIYAVELVGATRRHPAVRLGGSPRATIQLVRAAKVRAALDGRAFVLPDDLTSLLSPVLAHRLILTREHSASAAALDRVLAEVRDSVPVPLAQTR